MIDDEGVEVVLDGPGIEDGGKLIRLDEGTAGPVYKLGWGWRPTMPCCCIVHVVQVKDRSGRLSVTYRLHRWIFIVPIR